MSPYCSSQGVSSADPSAYTSTISVAADEPNGVEVVDVGGRGRSHPRLRGTPPPADRGHASQHASRGCCRRSPFATASRTCAIAGIESALEADLDEDSGGVGGCDQRIHRRQVERDWLLAEHRHGGVRGRGARGARVRRSRLRSRRPSTPAATSSSGVSAASIPSSAATLRARPRSASATVSDERPRAPAACGRGGRRSCPRRQGPERSRVVPRRDRYASARVASMPRITASQASRPVPRRAARRAGRRRAAVLRRLLRDLRARQRRRDRRGAVRDPELADVLPGARTSRRWSTPPSGYARHEEPARRRSHARRSIGPGATNMVTGAALATVNRLPVLLLPGDVFASRRPDPCCSSSEDPQARRRLGERLLPAGVALLRPDLSGRAGRCPRRCRRCACLVEPGGDRCGDARLPAGRAGRGVSTFLRSFSSGASGTSRGPLPDEASLARAVERDPRRRSVR